LILMESRLVALYKSEEEYEVLEKFPGSTLLGKSYDPLFPYFLKVTCHQSTMHD
jgi:isoleucyl-tRNA synthetase